MDPPSLDMPHQLPLGELEPCAGPLLAIFLSLFHTRIPRQEPRLPKRRSYGGVYSEEGAGDTKPNGPGLPGQSPTGYINAEVELTFYPHRFQGLNRQGLMGRTPEVFLERSSVDRYLPVTGRQPHSCDRGFSSAGPIQRFFRWHGCNLSLLDGRLHKWYRLL